MDLSWIPYARQMHAKDYLVVVVSSLTINVPMNMKIVLFLKLNKDLWSQHDVTKIYLNKHA